MRRRNNGGGEGKPSITTVLEHYGSPPLAETINGWEKTSCIFHEDNDPSGSYNSSYNAYHCFSCLFSGDSWTIIMEKEGTDFAGAIRFAEEQFGYSGSESSYRVDGQVHYRTSISAQFLELQDISRVAAVRVGDREVSLQPEA